MTAHSDLSERLRNLAYHWRLKGFPTDADTYDLAAGEIARLTAENLRLRASLKPFAHAITQAEISQPSDTGSRLTAARDHITLQVLKEARAVLLADDADAAPSQARIVGWMAESRAHGGRLFAHDEAHARERGHEAYNPHPFEVVPLVVADAASPASGWQPIETAPRDRYVLLFDPDTPDWDGNMEVGKWFGEDDGCFWSSGGPNGGLELHMGQGDRFTYWMERPAPPSDPIVRGQHRDQNQ